MLCSEWKQGKVPGALDGSSQSALVFGARPCLATRLDLSPLSEKPSRGRDVLVVDLPALVQAECTYLAPWPETPAGMPSRPALSLSAGLLTHLPIYSFSVRPLSSRQTCVREKGERSSYSVSSCSADRSLGRGPSIIISLAITSVRNRLLPAGCSQPRV